jgi:ParB family chromosome partitioning protein
VNIVEVPLGQIQIGERRRQDFGDIDGLAKGIKRVGLLEPIIVESNGGEYRYRLVVGERRLRAAWLLGWKTIPAQLREHLSEAELRDIELEENENRKSLTERERTRTFESSKKLVENAKRAVEVLAQSAPKVSTGGRPAEPASTRAVAEALGIDRRTVDRAEQHVETAERFPFMQAGKWRQSDVLRIRERIAELPEEEHEQAAGVLGCAKLLDPDMAVELMENLGAKNPQERQEIYELSRSTDPRDISLALTKAANLPPMPDRRLGIIDNALHVLNAAIRPFPKDPLTPRFISIVSELQAVRLQVKEVSYDAQVIRQEKVQ